MRCMKHFPISKLSLFTHLRNYDGWFARDYRFYKEDLIHPNNQAIQYIWEKFGNAYFSDEVKTFINENYKIKAALEHRPIDEKSPKYLDFLEKLKENSASTTERWNIRFYGMKIRKININDLETLRNISIQTFRETFDEVNTEEDMQKYLDENLSLERLNELENTNSEFYFAENNNEILGYLKLNFKDAQTEK